ncbi:MAG: co-chaperone GroES [Fimbriimonadia bacterium]|nr:co-chaperone GroES [Fimbriimonadia bacterium]
MKFRPLNEKVVLEVIEEDETSPGGIILPDTAKKRSQEAIVYAVGPGRLLKDGSRAAVAVQVGQKVVFSKYAGSEFEFDGKKYLILDEDQIFAIRES